MGPQTTNMFPGVLRLLSPLKQARVCFITHELSLLLTDFAVCGVKLY